jgi:hypothetical protein
MLADTLISSKMRLLSKGYCVFSQYPCFLFCCAYIIKAIRIEKPAFRTNAADCSSAVCRGQTQCEAPRAYNALDAERSIIPSGKRITPRPNKFPVLFDRKTLGIRLQVTIV